MAENVNDKGSVVETPTGIEAGEVTVRKLILKAKSKHYYNAKATVEYQVL